jgi:hypothetical protein
MTRIRFALLLLAAASVTACSSEDVPTLAAVVAWVLAAGAIVARYVRALAPLHGWLPARWRWLPAAVLGALGILAERLPAAATWADLGEAVVVAGVLVALAAAAGLHAPESGESP